MMSAQEWFEKFVAFGRRPSPDTYTVLFHPEGSVEDAGMATPTLARDTGAAIALVLSKVPDLFIDMRRYRANGDTLFVDAHNRGTLAGQKLDWRAVYRVHLRDGLVHRGRRFYDQAELMRPLLAGRPTLPAFTPSGSAGPAGTPRAFSPEDYAHALVSRNAEAQASMFAARGELESAGQSTALARASIAAYLDYFDRLLGTQRVEVSHHAGDDSLVFFEWRLTGSYGGQPLTLDGVDLLELSGRNITSARRHFDTLSLLAKTDPQIAAIRASVIAGSR